MRALILYSSTGRMAAVAQGLARGLQSIGFTVQLLEAGQSQGSPVPVGQYDLVCVGSPAVGPLGGQIATDIENTMKRATRMEGKTCAAFVRSKLFGSAKSLRKLMAIMEQQGAWVQDFAALSSPGEAEKFGKRLKTIGQ
jgi:menaquinone-dependent protoporphyrinogen IX oxidase